MQGKILLRVPNWLGDAVMSLPALWAVKGAFPEASLSVLARASVADLYGDDPHVDEVILYEGKALGARWRLLRRLRRERFQLAVLLQNAFDAALLARLSGIPERWGYARDLRGPLLSKAVPCGTKERGLHHIQYYLHMLRALGLEAPFRMPWIYLSLRERLWAREMLKGLRRPVVGLCPGAAYGQAKRWRGFASLARLLPKELGGSVLVLGSRADEAVAREVASAQVLSLVGRSSLREFFALASQCDALVSNDSGAMHVGYAVGVPVVAVFGSTDPALTGPPPGAAARIIRRELHCSPCFERHCPEGHLRCLEDISPREVLQALKELLPSRRAVFLDRDGTLCQDPGYLSRWEDFRPLPGLQELRRLKEAGFLLVGITNQSGIARGLVREEFVQEVNAYFLREHGFDAFYYCPHHPREHCSCRKPSPGMLLRARAELGVDLRRSWLVGDKELDLEAAQAVGARAVKVGAPMGLKKAVEFILKEELKDANSPGD